MIVHRRSKCAAAGGWCSQTAGGSKRAGFSCVCAAVAAVSLPLLLHCSCDLWLDHDLAALPSRLPVCIHCFFALPEECQHPFASSLPRMPTTNRVHCILLPRRRRWRCRSPAAAACRPRTSSRSSVSRGMMRRSQLPPMSSRGLRQRPAAARRAALVERWWRAAVQLARGRA